MKMDYVPPEQDDNKNPLLTYAVNLTDSAKAGKIDPVIGRDNEIRRVIQILSRRTKNNPVLLGDPGVGKTAIVEGLAQRIVNGDVPGTLKHKQLLVLDLAALLAGAQYRGQFEQRLKSVLLEIEKAQDKYILFIDELHTLVGAGSAEGSVDASNMLKPALARGLLHAIGATTVREYRQYIERDPALERRFQPIYIDEPTIEDSIAILRGIKEKYETHHGIKISDDAVISSVMLSVRFISDRYLPDKAIDLIDEAAAAAKIEIDSMPTSLDEIKRKTIQLDIELAALKKEKGVEERKKQLENQRADLQKDFDRLNELWQHQKKIIGELQKYRLEIDRLKIDLETAEREALLEKAAEIKYSKIPNIEKKLKILESDWQKIPEENRLLKEQVTQEDIAKIVSRWTRIPLTKLLSSETDKLVHLTAQLQKRIVGQDYALDKISKAIKRSRVGLSEENKPIGSFLFLGPTGVGKTETAKALSEALFDDEKNMIRIDMTEYSEAHSVARLIGAPPGYVGYEEGGQLTETVRRKPYSVILFDEIEKAHPQIFNVFLQILDDGRLTDGRGRIVNFKNTIIIMTSNLGSDIMANNEKITSGRTSEVEEERSDGKTSEVKKANDDKLKKVMALVRTFFKPELLNRIDSIILFNPLDKTIMAKIVELQLELTEQRISKQDIKIEFTDSLKKYLLEVGFDEIYGARPLKRIINELIIDEIALQILEEKIKPKDKLMIDWKNNKLDIKIKSVN